MGGGRGRRHDLMQPLHPCDRWPALPVPKASPRGQAWPTVAHCWRPHLLAGCRAAQEAGVAGSSATYATLCDVFAKQGNWAKLRTAVQVKGGRVGRQAGKHGGPCPP